MRRRRLLQDNNHHGSHDVHLQQSASESARLLPIRSSGHMQQRRASFNRLRRGTIVASVVIEVIALVLYIAMNEVSWNGSNVNASDTSFALCVAINVCSMVNAILIIVCAVGHAQYFRHKQQREVDISRMLHHRSSIRVSSLEAVHSWFYSGAFLPFVVKLMMVIPQPFPFIDIFVASGIGMFLFVRCTLALVLAMLDFSQYASIHQKHALKALSSRSKRKHFHTLPLKALLFVFPLQFLSLVLVVGALSFGYCIYVAERIFQPASFTLWESLYLAAQILVTGWAGDAFSTLNPVGRLTKAICLLCVVFGLFVFFWLLAILSEWLVPTQQERESILAVRVARLERSVAEAAAIVIQRWYRMERNPILQSMQRLDMARRAFVHERRNLMKFSDRFVVAPSEAEKDNSADVERLSGEIASLRDEVRALMAQLGKGKIEASV